MRKTFFSIVVALLSLFMSNAYAQIGIINPPTKKHISREQALNKVKQYYAGKDVDYYGSGGYIAPIITTKDTIIYAVKNGMAPSSSIPGIITFDTNWIILVDEEPTKGWNHNCTIYTIPNTITTFGNTFDDFLIRPISIEHLDSFPSNKKFIPLEVKNRYGNKADMKLRIPPMSQSNSASEAAKHTYAIILSGGVSPISNYMRYWNDCSYIYQTLTNKYGVPKENIVPIMADGDDPGEDSYDYTSQKYVSSSLDLDFDGMDELKYAATKSNVTNEFEKMAAKIGTDDQFFLFVIDHGGTDDYMSTSYICLWNNERLYDTELSTLLDKINARSINVVLGQCFSGGFIDNIEKSGRVIATACTGSESSWACADIPYDEFVFLWTNAINERNTHTGESIFADVDNNGHVCMDEAFNFAQANDTRNETPMYSSTPRSVGEDLAFNNLPLDVDIYMRDNPEDTGKEPNLTAREFWNSPDIWMRNDSNGIEIQENEPIAVKDVDQDVYLYFRITNRGTKDYNGRGKYLHVNWANTALGQTAEAWLGLTNPNEGKPFGGEFFPPVEITKKIKAGESVVIRKRNTLPNAITQKCLSTGSNAHFCVLVRLKDSFSDPTISDDSLKKIIQLKQQSKRIVQKNITVIKGNEAANNSVPIIVRNMTSNAANYDIEVLEDKRSTTTVFDKIELSMQLSTPILNAWKAGGMQGNNISYSTQNPQMVRLLNTGSKLKNIKLTGTQANDVKFTVRPLANSTIATNDTLRFHIAQTDADGNYVGGEAFEVRLSPRPAMSPTANYKVSNGNYILEADNVQEDASYEWYDENNNIVGHGKNISLPIEKFGQYKLRAIATKDGAVSYANVNIASAMHIKSATHTNNKKEIDIEISMPATEKTKIKVTSISNPTFNKTYGINKNETSTSVNINGCPSGVCLITLEENGIAIDSKRIVND